MNRIFKKIQNIFKKKELVAENNNINVIKPESFELDICWTDISCGQNANILTASMKRHGIYGYATESMIILEDGSEYIPEQLTEHWNAFHNSLKMKPKVITYNLLLS